MNHLHQWICRSAYWKRRLQEKTLPSVVNEAGFGDNVLEIGPGPGFSTDWLSQRFNHLTAVEIDHKLACLVETRLRDTNVRVVQANGAELPFKDESFSGAFALTMLHHVSSAEIQDQMLWEICRVLQPSAVFAGADSVENWLMSLIHIGDTFVPVDPKALPARLTAAGFSDISVVVDERSFRFVARRK